ncbi:MAG: hypothetical protein K9H61_14510 [Bacteroidia bacterium]|nr:hypothetical protein [Bacteroidia bacterium]MCF8448200.1 hypothetical protein [Bacteroidia bacterium]
MNTTKIFKNSLERLLFLLGMIVLLSLNNLIHALPINEPRIQATDLANSTAFKSLIGAERLAEFRQLENLIKPAAAFDGPAPDYDYFIGDYKMTTEDLVFLLGEPDVKIAPCMWQYNLSPGNNGYAVIGLDENGFVSYIVLKNCN